MKKQWNKAVFVKTTYGKQKRGDFRHLFFYARIFLEGMAAAGMTAATSASTATTAAAAAAGALRTVFLGLMCKDGMWFI